MTDAEMHNEGGIDYTDLLPIINATSEPIAPLQALHQKLDGFFHNGPEAAFAAYQNLREGIVKSRHMVRGPRVEIPVTSDLGVLYRIFGVNINASTFWRSQSVADTLVLLFSCSIDAIQDVATDDGRTFGGAPTYEAIQKTPTASLPKAFYEAKSTALGTGQTTVLVVSLHDAYSIELDAREDPGEYFRFSHSFTMGIGPEGVRIWQAWGHNGYRFDEYIRDDHARLRNWDEADEFVSSFNDLASQNGTWTSNVNVLYKRLFHININRLCGDDAPEPPIVPQFRAWVRIRAFEDVTYDKVTKFLWVK